MRALGIKKALTPTRKYMRIEVVWKEINTTDTDTNQLENTFTAN